MKAMILAAGRGERMRPLTDTCPKPLLPLHGTQTLISRHIVRLAAAGIRRIVVNHAWLGGKIQAALGSGSRYGVEIAYSAEPAGGLETAGGIATALPLLGGNPFLVVNGDIFTDFPFQAAFAVAENLQRSTERDAHLWLAENPPHHPQGDFSVNADGTAGGGQPKYTFTGIAVYHPRFFAEVPRGQKIPLAPYFQAACRAGRIGAEIFRGQWLDVGTPERLLAAQQAAARENTR